MQWQSESSEITEISSRACLAVASGLLLAFEFLDWDCDLDWAWVRVRVQFQGLRIVQAIQPGQLFWPKTISQKPGDFGRDFLPYFSHYLTRSLSSCDCLCCCCCCCCHKKCRDPGQGIAYGQDCGRLKELEEFGGAGGGRPCHMLSATVTYTNISENAAVGRRRRLEVCRRRPVPGLHL
uniref:HDC15708 n=1 Tax=Drosophila melanogaster TaxID=7227 RepID=Q6IJ83_DROME|nr:TPA_inf: HDC15708 [Drosophila melanogaster]